MVKLQCRNIFFEKISRVRAISIKSVIFVKKFSSMQAIRSHHTALIMVAILAVGAVVTSVLQVVVGNFPVEFFAFPMNVVVQLLWALSLAELYRRRKESGVAKFMLSVEATYLSLALAAVGGVVVGVMSESPTQTWAFVAMMFFVMSHLMLVTMRGWRNRSGIRWRFVLNHTGLLLALGAGFWGAPDIEELRLPLVEERPASDAYCIDGQSVPLGYEMTLLDFDATYFDNGVPSDYVAKVDIAGSEVALRVNTPYARRLGEDIYLVNYEKDLVGRTCCVVQVVRDGWYPVMVAGIVMMLVGALLLFLQGARREVAQ